MRTVVARTVTETEIPAFAPEESWRSVGRSASGVSVGEEGEVVGVEGIGLGVCEGFAADPVGTVGVVGFEAEFVVGGDGSEIEEVGAATL